MALHDENEPVAAPRQEYGARQVCQEEAKQRTALNHEGSEQGRAGNPNQKIPIGQGKA